VVNDREGVGVSRPLRIEYPGAFYHVTSRGNERKTVFQSNRDREKYLSYLESAHERYGAVIHVYCLMGNHYHLLLETQRGIFQRFFIILMERTQPTSISKGVDRGIFFRGGLKGYWSIKKNTVRSYLVIFTSTL
jgi:REP element-mobilizing transposase RayT